MVILVAGVPGFRWAGGVYTPHTLLDTLLLIQEWELENPHAWNRVTWSLSAEWLAYGFFPFMVWATYRMRGAALCLRCALAAIFFLVLAVGATHSRTLDHTGLGGLMRCACEFTAGMFACRAQALGNSLLTPANNRLTLAGLVIVAVAQIRPGYFELLAPFGFLALVLGCAVGDSLANRLFGNRVVVFLGDISFSLYLTHLVVIQIFAIPIVSDALRLGTTVDRFSTVGLAVVVIYGTAWASWQYIEVPFQKLGRIVIRRLEAGMQPV